MAGNWERSEGIPVGRSTAKTRAAACLKQARGSPPPSPGGTGHFRTGMVDVVLKTAEGAHVGGVTMEINSYVGSRRRQNGVFLYLFLYLSFNIVFCIL